MGQFEFVCDNEFTIPIQVIMDNQCCSRQISQSDCSIEEYVPEEEQITLPAATSMNFKQARLTTPVAPHRDGRPEKRPRIGSTPERPTY